jgi:hypothetical protein
MKPEELAELFHDTYERLAPECGYITRKKSQVPFADLPKENKNLMVEVCKVVLNEMLPYAVCQCNSCQGIIVHDSDCACHDKDNDACTCGAAPVARMVLGIK